MAKEQTIITIQNINFSKNTKISEVLDNPRFQHFDSECEFIDIFKAKDIKIDNYIFDVRIIFINKLINKIYLFPENLTVDDPGYPDKTYQKIKRKNNDGFLKAKYGEPLTVTDNVTFYEFEWGRISSLSCLSGPNEYAGGFIEISVR